MSKQEQFWQIFCCDNFDFNLTKKLLFFFAGKKGGALLSALHSNMQHGDPFVKSLVRHTLNLVSAMGRV